MRQRVGIATTLALATVAALVAPASAQTGTRVIRDGSYEGYLNFNAGLIPVDPNAIGSSVRARTTGSADLSVIDGAVNGSADFVATADVTIGPASGSDTIDVPASVGGSASAPTLTAMGATQPLTVTYAGCSQVWGTWGEGFRDAALQAGVAEVRYAYGSFNFQAKSDVTSPEEAAQKREEMTVLFDEVQLAMQQAEAGGSSLRFPDAIRLLVDEVRKVQSELSIGSPCSGRRDGVSDAEAERFLSQISQLLFDFAMAMLDDPNFSPTPADWASIVSDLSRAGLLGSSAGDQAKADTLTAEITKIFERDMDLYVAGDALTKGQPLAVAALRNALAVNPETRVGNITATEAAILIGLN